MKICKYFSMISFIFYLNTSIANPITSFGESIYASEFSIIEWAVLYEAAGYRHDLYYQFGNSEGYIATNNWNTGGAHGCDFCSYPGDYGTFTLGQSSTSNEIIFRLEINNSPIDPLFSGSASNNPDNLVHAWLANAEGLLYIDDIFQLNTLNESFDIATLLTHYEDNLEINDLLTSEQTRFVGFEDIIYGGDLDYNDIIFAFRGISAPSEVLNASEVPAPSVVLLFGLGIVCLLARIKFQG